jgi:hypothetical protein
MEHRRRAWLRCYRAASASVKASSPTAVPRGDRVASAPRAHSMSAATPIRDDAITAIANIAPRLASKHTAGASTSARDASDLDERLGR